MWRSNGAQADRIMAANGINIMLAKISGAIEMALAYRCRARLPLRGSVSTSKEKAAAAWRKTMKNSNDVWRNNGEA